MSTKKRKGRQGDFSQRKRDYFVNLRELLAEYPKVMLVAVDNVSAVQLQTIRKLTRGTSVLRMGKNTLIRKCMREMVEEGRTELAPFIDAITGNIGMLFTKGDLSEIKEQIEALKVAAPAKPGSIAPVDVIIPPGPTGLEPTATSFLQALNISTKIARGQVEILQAHKLITAGVKVKPGEAALLDKLKIMPFSYCATVLTVFENGFVYPAEWLDLSDSDVLGKFGLGCAQVAALSLEIGYPTMASIPHSIANAFRGLMAISVETDYNIEGAEQIKEMLANPDAFISAAPAPAAASADAAPAAAAEPSEESESESMGLDLFG